MIIIRICGLCCVGLDMLDCLRVEACGWGDGTPTARQPRGLAGHSTWRCQDDFLYSEFEQGAASSQLPVWRNSITMLLLLLLSNPNVLVWT